MTDLVPREKKSPGRKRVTTASAWVSREKGRRFWISNVYVGSGRVQTLSTGTVSRVKALDFNRCHLLKALNGQVASQHANEHQLEFM